MRRRPIRVNVSFQGLSEAFFELSVNAETSDEAAALEEIAEAIRDYSGAYHNRFHFTLLPNAYEFIKPEFIKPPMKTPIKLRLRPWEGILKNTIFGGKFKDKMEDLFYFVNDFCNQTWRLVFYLLVCVPFLVFFFPFVAFEVMRNNCLILRRYTRNVSYRFGRRLRHCSRKLRRKDHQ